MMTATVVASANTDASYGVETIARGGQCARCRTGLGRIINRGAACRVCMQRVCKSCREYERSSATHWLCTSCHRSQDINSKFWLTELVERTSNKLQCSIKNSIQRSLTFSESSPSPWSALRGSPELRAYSSMPRHHDNASVDSAASRLHDNAAARHHDNASVDTAAPNRRPRPFPRRHHRLEKGNDAGLETGCDQTDFKVVDTCGTVLDLPCLHPALTGPAEGEGQGSPTLKPRAPPSPTSAALASLRRKMVDLKQLPPGVTPPRSRRLFLNGCRLEDPLLQDPSYSPIYDPGTGRVFIPDGEDYKLVFLSSSESSSREDQSDDASSTCSGVIGLMDDADWDYFENSAKTIPVLTDFHRKTQKSILVPIERESQEERGSGEVEGTARGASSPVSHAEYLGPVASYVPLPIPVPIPVPIFVPVPCNNPELTIRVEHYLSPNFWSNFLATNGNLANVFANNRLSNGNDEIFGHDTGSSRTNASMETSRVITPSDRETNREINDSETNRDEGNVESVSRESEPMLLKNKKSFEVSVLNESVTSEPMLLKNNKSIPDVPQDPAVTLQTYRRLEEDVCGKAAPLHPDEDQFSSLSDSSDSSSARSPVKRKYRFNRSDLAEENISSSDSSDCSSDEEDAEQKTASVKKDISLSTILNFDNSLRVDAGEKNEKETNVPRIEVSKRCDLKTNSFSNQLLASCDNSVSHVSQESKLDLSDIRSVDAADLRSSDEFSGTESMELVPHDDEQGHVTSLGASESCKEQSSGPFTSLVMITDHVTTENESERDSPVHVNVVTNDTTTFVPSKDKEKFKLTLNTSDSAGEKESDSSGNLELAVQSEEDQVRVVTGGNTMSAVVCLEEGLADDDSWVEELDREEMPITDSSEGEQEFPDREEELRGYHRTAIDYSLFTIIEESCEESEVEEKSRPTQLENYFLRALGGADTISLRIDDTVSETSSVFSEDVESADNLEPEEKPFKSEIGTSRLEQYFLTELVGFSRRDSDGSVGSDSEGRPSPEQRRKRLVRARGTGRHYSSSLDNLTESEQLVEMQLESENSSSETDSRDESSLFEKNDGQFDTVKRTKKKKRSVTSAPSLEMLDVPEEHSLNDEPREEANSENEKADEMELIHQSDRNKHQSRDSGFMGSSDDLIKETKTVEPDVSLTEEVEEEVAEPEAKPEKQSEETPSVIPPEPTPPVTAPPTTPTITLSRKDSFNNWSSDEETNLMMSKMKAFFKTMVANQPKPSSPTMKPRVHKPPQLIHFENELTRLMKTVPGLREEQVREIVEYLSSEDTWSDSYDSSDYTSSDLEQTRDSALVYQRLLASFHKVDKASLPHNSPPLIAKVMQHIGGRLVALMHEVSSGESAASPRLARHHRRLQPKLSNISTTTEEEEEGLDFTPLPRSKSHDPLLEEARQEASDNERFSWRGSFESALMVSDSRGRLASGGEMSTSASALAIAHAKRRSAGDLLFQSREQLDRVRSCGSIGGSVEKMWPLRTHGSVPDSGGSADGEEESEEDAGGGRSTLPRSLQSSCAAGTHSLPRLPTSGASPSIYKTHAGVKSARYRPPGYSRAGAAPPPRRDTRRRAQLTPPPLAAHLNATSLGSPEDLLGSPESQYNKSAPSILVEDEVPEKISQHNKSLLGARSDSMASVYSGAGEGRYGSVTVKGEVEFGLQYNYKQGALEIHVKQCKELAPVDAKRMRSDPYVKVYLLPDKSKAGKRKTRVKKHTLSPVFDEVLKFHLTLEDLESRTLWLSVWHSDMFGRNDFLGEVMMPLEHKVFDDPAPKSYVLQERSEILDELICSKGELIIGLKFVPAATEGAASKKSAAQAATGSLHVLIKEAKSLCPVKSNSSLDAFCKAYLLPDKGRKHKTGIVKRSTSPQWNHTVVYKDVTLDELSERCLELTVWDHDRLTSNEFLGGIRLNLGHGKHYSKLVDWMDSSGKEILLWQQMMERPNFWVESCIALRPSLDLRNN